MNEPSASQVDLWQRRWLSIRSAVRQNVQRALPFLSGVIAALVALLLYNWFFPAPAPLTLNEVNDSVNELLASGVSMM